MFTRLLEYIFPSPPPPPPLSLPPSLSHVRGRSRDRAPWLRLSPPRRCARRASRASDGSPSQGPPRSAPAAWRPPVTVPSAARARLPRGGARGAHFKQNHGRKPPGAEEAKAVLARHVSARQAHRRLTHSLALRPCPRSTPGLVASNGVGAGGGERTQRRGRAPRPGRGGGQVEALKRGRPGARDRLLLLRHPPDARTHRLLRTRCSAPHTRLAYFGGAGRRHTRGCCKDLFAPQLACRGMLLAAKSMPVVCSGRRIPHICLPP